MEKIKTNKAELRPNEEVERISVLWRHPDHKPNLDNEAKYVLREIGHAESFCGRNQEKVGSMLEARIHSGAYLNRTCWNWMSFDWEAIAF